MTNGVEGALYIMITAVVIGINHDAVCCTCWNFVNKHPSIQILGLSFDINRYDVATESAHLSML
jgi:hypothetical protein